MRDVTLSVLLPVYNGERYVGKTIESVLSQSYAGFELLILDDGSSDRTPEILADYAARDGRIRLFRHDNHGVGFTLSRGLAEARGTFVAELGADDLALPERFRKQVDFLATHPDHVLVGAYLRIIDSGDRPIGLRKYPTDDEQLRSHMALYNPIGSPSAMYRRADAVAAGGYTSRFRTCEDYDFILRLARRGKVANLAEPLTAYRLHASATKSMGTHAQLRDTLRIKRIAYAEYGYRQTLKARAVNLGQAALALLPSPVVYWLFTKTFVLKAQDVAVANE